MIEKGVFTAKGWVVLGLIASVVFVNGVKANDPPCPPLDPCPSPCPCPPPIPIPIEPDPDPLPVPDPGGPGFYVAL